jgi:hypothetical protein
MHENDGAVSGIRSAIVAAAVALVFYAVVLVTAGKRAALLAGLCLFAVTYIAPLVQRFYARRHADRARQTELRDAHRFAKEMAEYARKPQLQVVLEDGNAADFRPAGGHRTPNAAVAFTAYVVNTGDAPATNVVVRIGLANDARQVLLPEKKAMVAGDDGARAWIAVDDLSEAQLVFGPHDGPPALARDMAVAALRRPLLPHQPRRLGTIAVIAPAGTHRFPWAVESSAGAFRSNVDTALCVTVHDAAEGHDPIADAARPADACSRCRALAKLPAWTTRVDRELNRFRGDRRANPQRTPRLSTSPGSAQWHQETSGPQRWVTCDIVAGRDDVVRASFWTNGDWEHREERIVAMSDAAPFAADIWDYLKTATVIELAEARVARAR